MGKLVRTVIRFVIKLIIYLIIAVILLVTIEYIFCPFYRFADPRPFSGKFLFNPYQSIDDPQWKKANFQVQSYSWLGITDGRRNSNRAIDSVYSYMSYDIKAISDYQKISLYGYGEPGYLPVYEHGYGIWKNHQVLIGAREVLWTDYPVFQTLHHKQHILDLLRRDNELVFIAHPRMRGGYSPEDMKYLTNYDGLEVLNGFGNSIEHWDAALSAGKMVTVLANDDAHNVFRPDDVGNLCTMIHSGTIQSDDVIRALKNGEAFGVDFRVPGKHSYDEKKERILNVPDLQKVKLYGDSLLVKVSRAPVQMRFIGQGGQVRQVVHEQDSVVYVIRHEDTYIRTEIEFSNGTVFYLNPVIRFDGTDPWKMEKAELALLPTWLLRVAGISVLLLLGWLFIRGQFRKP